MTTFCRSFFGQQPHDVQACPQCRQAQEDAVFAGAMQFHAKNPGPKGIFPRRDPRLDHQGRP